MLTHTITFLEQTKPRAVLAILREGAMATLHTFYGKQVVHGDLAYMHRGCEKASGDLAYILWKANGPWRLCIVASL